MNRTRVRHFQDGGWGAAFDPHLNPSNGDLSPGPRASMNASGEIVVAWSEYVTTDYDQNGLLFR